MRRLRSILAIIYRSVLRPVARLSRRLVGLVPALLAGAGVFLVVAGLFYYLQPAAAQPLPTPAAPPTIAPSVLYSLPPTRSLAPSGSTSIQEAAATRLRVPALGIDLPIIPSPPGEEWPLCDVAEIFPLGHAQEAPGLPQALYVYAHAQAGMFLPLLTASQVNNGAAMIGMYVEVYTDDNQNHVYEITEVLRHGPYNSSLFDRALAATTDQLWLQTSEDSSASGTKLEVVAEPIGVIAATQAAAHPAGKGRVCPEGAPRCRVKGDSGCRP
jgi:hypothetical protein